MDSLTRLERLARAAGQLGGPRDVAVEDATAHPFEIRNVHPDLPLKVKKLFDSGHFAEATFAAFKFIEAEIRRISKIRGATGFALMMKAFDESGPALRLNGLTSDSDVDEQKGFRHMFAGAQAGIRNPRGHEVDVDETLDDCLDHLSVASALMRRLDRAGLR